MDKLQDCFLQKDSLLISINIYLSQIDIDDLETVKISVSNVFGEPDKGCKNMTVDKWISFYLGTDSV